VSVRGGDVDGGEQLIVVVDVATATRSTPIPRERPNGRFTQVVNVYPRPAIMSALVPASTAEHPGVRSRYDRTRRSESNARISRLPSILGAVRCRIADNVIARDVQDAFRQARAANRRVMIAPDRSVIHRFVSQRYRVSSIRRRMDNKFIYFFFFIHFYEM